MIEFLSPGAVGSVGDALGQVQLKTSCPEQPIRNSFSAAQNVMHGSNVQDGQDANFIRYGQPYVIDKKLVNLSIKTPYGWTTQDVRASDKRYEPTLSQTFSSFEGLAARTYNARLTGNLFLPLPGAYEAGPNQIPRGGLTPRITDLAAGDFTPGQGSVVTNPIVMEPQKGLGQYQQNPDYNRLFAYLPEKRNSRIM